MNDRGSTGCLVAVIVFLVVVVLMGAAVFFFLFRNSSDMPDIDEFMSEIEKSKENSDGTGSITDNLQIQIGEGSTEFSFRLSNADLTVLANDAISGNEEMPVEDILLNCNEDSTIDVTALITDLSFIKDNPDTPSIAKFLLSGISNKRIYATLYIEYIGDDEFDIRIDDVRFEKLSIPFAKTIFTPMADEIGNMLTRQLEAMGNFELQEFSVEENYLEFSGTMK